MIRAGGSAVRRFLFPRVRATSEDAEPTLGILLLIAVIMAGALAFQGQCYGEGWCRWAGAPYTDTYGRTVHAKGSGGQVFNFRLGGWPR